MNSHSPYAIKWVDLSYLGYPDSIGIGSLPGCTFRFINRNLQADADVLLSNGIQQAIILMDDIELRRFGGSQLISVLRSKDIYCRQYPCEIGHFPSIEDVMDIISDVFRNIERGNKTIIISRDGFGRSCAMAGAILLHTNDNLLYDQAYDTLKKAVGPRALQTVKQYNFLVDFRQLRDNYDDTKESEYSRSISR